MAKRRLFHYLAAAGGYIGIGMLLGYALGDKANNTALWIGIILILLGAVLLGMAISTGPTPGTPERPASSSGNLTDDPRV